MDTKSTQVLMRVADAGALVCSTLAGVILCLGTVGWARIRLPLAVALFAVWSAFLWVRYWRERRQRHWHAWITGACAFLLTSTTLLLILFMATKALG